MNDDTSDVLLTIIAVVFACSLTALLTAAMVWGEAKRAALENNCGQYNAKTGAFEWVRRQPLQTEKPDES